MNFLLAREYGDPRDLGVYMSGTPGVEFEIHASSLLEACAVPGTRAIVYSNNPGGLAGFSSRQVRATVPALEAIEREYPTAAADARTFREALLRSRGYHEGIDPPLVDLASPWLRLQFRKLAHLGGLQLWRRDGADRVVALADACARTYDDPATRTVMTRHMPPPESYWIAAGGDAVWRAWLRMAAEMCRSRGIRFVYYVPPHLNATERELEESFRPRFVNAIREVLAPFPNAIVIDHSGNRELGDADLVWVPADPVGSEHCKTGYLFNLVGQIKRCRLLLDELARLPELGIGRRSATLGWSGERSLPRCDHPVTFLPGLRPDILETNLRDPLLRLTQPAN